MKKQYTKKDRIARVIVLVLILAAIGIGTKHLHKQLTRRAEGPYQGQVTLISNPAETYDRAATQTGCYSLLNENLMYTDYSTGRQFYLCGDPACTHTSDSCTSWLGNTVGEVYLFAVPDGSSLYYAQQGNGEAENRDAQFSSIFAMNPDGSERHVLTQLKENARITGGIAADAQFLYYNVVTVKGITAEPMIQLMRTDRDSGETEVLLKNLPVSYHMKSACGSYLIYETSDENGIQWKAFDLKTQAFQELYGYGYDDFEGKTAVYQNMLFLLAKKQETQGTLMVYDLITGETNTIENVPIYAGDTCHFGGFFDDSWLVIDDVDNRNLSDVRELRHLVNVKTGEVLENDLTMDWYGERSPIAILAEAGDSLLVQTASEEAEIASIQDGVEVGLKQQIPVLSLILKEDFYRSKANYVPIHNEYKRK